MINFRKVVVAFGLLAALDGRAELVELFPGTGTHWELQGNYVTGAALYAACANLANSEGQSVTTWCGSTAPIDNPNSYSRIRGGWFPTGFIPPYTWSRFYYINAWACQNNDYVRYFPDTKSCVLVTRVATPLPASPKANGTSCPANAQSRQPTCGNPIAIGTGNKVQLEVDYVAHAPGS